MQVLLEIAAGYWWVFVFFVFPAIGGACEEVLRWNRRRLKARRKHQLALARIRAGRALPEPESAALREARETLQRRYAAGEMTREDFLQAKVELEDL